MSTTPKNPYGLGRRKTARAQALLLADPALRTINGQEFAAYFPTVAMQHAALAPLLLTSQHDVVGFKVKVGGGGKHSQADAVRLALARALLEKDIAFHKQLKDAGLLTRDSRMKERKKFGLKRARRAPQFSKR